MGRWGFAEAQPPSTRREMTVAQVRMTEEAPGTKTQEEQVLGTGTFPGHCCLVIEALLSWGFAETPGHLVFQWKMISGFSVVTITASVTSVVIV